MQALQRFKTSKYQTRTKTLHFQFLTHLVKLVNTTDLKSVPIGLPVQVRQWVRNFALLFEEIKWSVLRKRIYAGKKEKKKRDLS